MITKLLFFESESGFTIIEIITVLVIIGILTVVAASRFDNSNNGMVAGEAVKTFIRYAQAQAMNTGRIHGIQCNGGQLSMFRNNTASLVRLPSEDSDTVDLTQDHISNITDFTVYFDSWGEPYSGAPTGTELSSDLNITVNGEFNIWVTEKTGYVR